jgi:flagellar FliJ protein
MKRFSFNLESVLNHRKLLEEREQEKLSKIHQALLLAQNQREKLRLEIEDCRHLMAKEQKGVIDLDKIRHLASYMEKLELEIVQLSHHILRIETEKQRQMELLVEARKQREIVDKLKEKRLATYEREGRELEQKLLDELSVVQFKHQGAKKLPGEESNS